MPPGCGGVRLVSFAGMIRRDVPLRDDLLCGSETRRPHEFVPVTTSDAERRRVTQRATPPPACDGQRTVPASFETMRFDSASESAHHPLRCSRWFATRAF